MQNNHEVNVLHEKIFSRTVILRTLTGFIFLILIIRLYYLMAIKGESLSKAAESQNSTMVSVSSARNDILDRNMMSFTGVNKSDYAVVFSTENTKEDFKLCEVLEKYSNENKYEIYSRLQLYKKTFVKAGNGFEEELEKYPNFSVISVSNRYLSDYPCAALIGYLNDNRGASGLEKVYDKVLSSSKSYGVKARADALMRFIPGSSKEVIGGSLKTDKLKTTLDLDYCRIAENVLKDKNLKAGVVLLDAKNFDVLAMASYPTFEPDNIGKYLNSEDGNLVNRCLSDYDMGSVFKIVVAAAAIEENLVDPDEMFECKGYCYIANQKIDCHNIYGHKKLTFKEAFMNSCNPIFIEVGQRIGYEKIIEYAEKFGMGRKMLNPTALAQSKGKLPDKSNYYLADVANISIGQGNLSGSALNGAIFSAIIANDGILKSINCVDSVVDSVGQKKRILRVEGKKRIISHKTAKIVKDMMVGTNLYGTGTTAYVETVGSGGKTGSAQTGWVVNGERYQHGWYTGFFPQDNPKFAMCVFVENGKSGSETAAPIFKEIAEIIMNTMN